MRGDLDLGDLFGALDTLAQAKSLSANIEYLEELRYEAANLPSAPLFEDLISKERILLRAKLEDLQVEFYGEVSELFKKWFDDDGNPKLEGLQHIDDIAITLDFDDPSQVCGVRGLEAICIRAAQENETGQFSLEEIFCV